jgi:hypothetical protein
VILPCAARSWHLQQPAVMLRLKPRKASRVY